MNPLHISNLSLENSKELNLMQQFRNLFKPNRFDKELEEALSASEETPNDLRLKIKIGEIYFKKREIAKGVSYFSSVAESFLESGFILKAIAIYKNIIRMLPGSVEYNEKLAELYHQIGMNKDAIIQYLIVVNYYQNHQNKEKVLESARKMVALDPEDIQNRMRLAEIYYNQGLQNEALMEYEEIGKQLKNKDEKEIGLLIDVLEKVFFRRPKDKELLYEICALYLKNNDPEPAMRKIEKNKLIDDAEFKSIYAEARKLFEERKK